MQAFTAAVLVLAANTAFNGFPILASILGHDGFLPRQFSRRGAVEDQAAPHPCLMIQFGHSTAVAQKATGSGEGAALENCGNAIACGQHAKDTASAQKEVIIRDDESLRRGQFGKRTLQLRAAACTNEFDLHANNLSSRKSFMNLRISTRIPWVDQNTKSSGSGNRLVQ